MLHVTSCTCFALTFDACNCLLRRRMTLAYYLKVAPGFQCLDLPQSIGRAPHRYDGLTPTIVEATVLWVTGKGRTLTGKELLLVTGVPLKYLSPARLAALKANTTHDVENLMASLAGNAWSGAAVLAVYIAVLAELPVSVFAGTSVDDEPADDSGAEADAVGAVLNCVLDAPRGSSCSSSPRPS